MIRALFLLATAASLSTPSLLAQGDEAGTSPLQAAKAVDDVMWRLELGGIAEVRTFRYTGLPRTPGGSPMILYAYSYIPKNLDRSKKHPLLVVIHGGVHSNHMTGGPANAATIVREMIERGYAVVGRTIAAAPATVTPTPRPSTTVARKTTTYSPPATGCSPATASSTPNASAWSAGATAA